MSPEPPAVELAELGLDQGAHLLLQRALRAAPGGLVRVRGTAPDLPGQLRAWARGQGHTVEAAPAGATGVVALLRAAPGRGRLAGAERAGSPAPEGQVGDPPARWGVALRGALVEAGAPAWDFPLHERTRVWADEVPRLYAEAVAAQWDPASAIDWAAPFTLDPEVEAAVVQVMTYLVENELAALVVPTRFLGRIHPHFREVLQLLAVQAADEARHVEVFTRRALLRGGPPGLSSAGGQASLKTLFDEPDFALMSFLLSVLGEGSFLSLLRFLRLHAPDPITARVCELAEKDEARHVAFGLAHLRHELAHDPGLRPRLAAAVERRHAALQHTAGLNAEVFDALVLLAAGEWSPAAIARGFELVAALQREMDQGRRQRLRQLGFSVAEAEALSALHTRNFM